jgi:hypothetical protein
VRRKSRINGQFAWRLVEMLESPAYRALSLSAHKVLARLEVELAHHGGEKGRQNGRLIVTYSNFEDYGMDRHSIGPAISEVVALGFVEVTEAGCAGNENFRRPNRFRLTYRPGGDGSEPTNDWRRIITAEQAESFASQARKQARINRSPVGVRNQRRWGKSTLPKEIPVGETPTTAMVEKPPLLSISRVGSAEEEAAEEASGSRSAPLIAL